MQNHRWLQARRGLVLVLAVVVAMGAYGSGAAQQSRSGGLGLTQDDWDEMFGPGEAGQSLMSYDTSDGYRMFVGMDNGAIDSIQINLETSDGGPLSPEDAEAMVESLLPSDADREDTFTSPVIAPGTITVLVQTWESDWLEDQFGDNDDRENFTVVYHQTGLEPLITLIVITVED
jgi:hypothetical protein